MQGIHIEHEFGRALEEIFPGDSRMAHAMRERDWASTPLGDPRDWPDALKIPLRMMLTSRFEMWLGWGPELHFFYNDAYIPTLGIKHPRMLGRPFKEVWAEVYDDVADQVERVRNGQATWNKALLLFLERNGYPEETYHSFSYSPLHKSDGSVGGLLCVVSEESERVIAERRVDTLRQLGTALVGAPDAEAVCQALRTVFTTHRRDFPFALYLARERGAIDDCAGSEDALPLLEREWPELRSDELEAGQIFALPQEIEWPRGAWDRSPREAVAIAIPRPSGDEAMGTLILGLNPYRPLDPEIAGFARLIAGQLSGALANIAALDSERRRADRIWSFSRDLMVVVDAEGVFRSVSPAWSRILGHAPEEVVGRSFAEFIHPDDLAASREAMAKALIDAGLTNYETRFLTVDGEPRWFAWHTSMEDGLVYAYGRDITEDKRAEEALRASQDQFRHLVQGVVDYAIYMIDPEGKVSSWNAGASRIKGYEPGEIIGTHFSQFYTPEDRERGDPDRALETARREGSFSAEGWRIRKNGERFRASVVIDAVCDDTGELIGFAKITRDITEREEAQSNLERAREALFQSQKMEAIGQLTGGVAHDFNNLLMAILSSMTLLRKRLGDDPLSHRLLDTATQGAERGATLTQRMLAFARRQNLKVDRLDLPQLLSGMGDLAQRTIGPEWPISTNLPMGLPAVIADANQLEMAILNLIVNARDATPRGGPIIITAAPVETVDTGTTWLMPGAYVRLSITDKGAGMDAETLRRATEPFFTTKGVGKGTGLGLPMVHGMAQQIGGAFTLESSPGTGTSAILWLPVAPQEAKPAADTLEGEVLAAVSRLNILAVDDDPLVLMNTAALLEDLGHSVVEADSAAEALELLRADESIELIITDQAMPGMTGLDLLDAAEALRPGIPAIIASGYGEGAAPPGRNVVRLSKPFSQANLAKALNDAINQGSGN